MRRAALLSDWRLRPARFLAVLVGVGFLTALVSCGDDPGLQPPRNAAFGTAGNILVADADGHQMWVGFNSAADWDYFLERNRDNAPTVMIGGTVVADTSQPNGFYLAPDTTMVRGTNEVLNVLWVQTTLDQVKSDPACYASMYGVLMPVAVQRYVSGRMW